MAKLLKYEEYEVSDDIIERDRLFSVYVFGLPRSGTSMMTHIIELLGVNMVYTSETEENKEKREKRYKQKLGEYHPNPTGFFEITEDSTNFLLKVVSKPYSGCKMIIPVNSFRWDLVKKYPCKVIMMTRDAEEIRQSQMAYYRRGEIAVEIIRTHLAMQKVRLKNHSIEHMVVDYHDVLDFPEKIIKKVAKFVNAPNLIDDAVESVQPKQNRFKKENLHVGI